MIFALMIFIFLLFIRVSSAHALLGGIGGFLPDSNNVSGYIDIDNRNESGKRSMEALGEYYEYRLEYEKEMTGESVVYTLAYIVQMVFYWLEFREKRKQRDEMIDKTMDFLKYLHDTKHTKDYAELPTIRSVLGMPSRDINPCIEAGHYINQAKEDADGLVKMEEMYTKTSPMGPIDGWGLHDALLVYPLAIASASELMVTTGKRRAEDYNDKRAQLVHKAHLNVRGLFTASTVLQYYHQAQTIYSGLVDLYISGFNSAGAGLGVSLQRLAAQGSTGSGGGLQVTAGRGAAISNGPVVPIGGATPVASSGK